jgi:phage terminase large subunit
LLEKDPSYIDTLENLPEDRKRADLYGEWDIYEGQYFSEWSREVHVCEPFEIPPSWRRYLTIDYGLDMFAAEWVAVNEYGYAFVYREFCKSGLTVSEAAEVIREINDQVYIAYAPPDLWNRRNDTGRSAADIFAEHGVYLARARNNRVQGWYDLKEWLHPIKDEQGEENCGIKFFRNCTEIIKCIPLLQFDQKDPNDVSKEPHNITHAPDAIRYFVAGHPLPASAENKQYTRSRDEYQEQMQSLLEF